MSRYLESVLLCCQYQRRDLLGELAVVADDRVVTTEERRSSVTLELLTYLVVLRMFNDQFGDLLVAEVDRRQQCLIDASLIDVVQQDSDGLEPMQERAENKLVKPSGLIIHNTVGIAVMRIFANVIYTDQCKLKELSSLSELCSP
jgi:hypothetical protein